MNYSMPNPGAPTVTFKNESSNVLYLWFALMLENVTEGAHVLTVMCLVLPWSKVISPSEILLGSAGLPTSA